jgi:hypothetical protein
MNKSLRQSIRPLLLVFVLTNALFIVFRQRLQAKGVDGEVLIGGNLILFLVSFAALFLTARSLNAANPQAFVRAIYGSFMIKFFVVAVTAFIYIMVAKKNVNKPALLACAALYIIYTGIEIRTLTKMLKQKKNA